MINNKHITKQITYGDKYDKNRLDEGSLKCVCNGMVEILNKVVRVGLIEKMIFESIFKGDVKSPKAF